MNIKKSDKIENGCKISEIYKVVMVANKCADGTINIDIYDGGEFDWRELVDCSTYEIKEFELPVK